MSLELMVIRFARQGDTRRVGLGLGGRGEPTPHVNGFKRVVLYAEHTRADISTLFIPFYVDWEGNLSYPSSRFYHIDVVKLAWGRGKGVLVHLYRNFMFNVIVKFFMLLQEAHVNQCYKHFYYFVTEHSMVDRKELEPLVTKFVLYTYVLSYSLD